MPCPNCIRKMIWTFSSHWGCWAWCCHECHIVEIKYPTPNQLTLFEES